MSAPNELSVGVRLGSVVRRRRGILSRSTADGYLLHTGADVVAVNGAVAEVWGQIVGETDVDVLVDWLATALATDRSGVAADVLGLLAELQRRHALEVVAE